MEPIITVRDLGKCIPAELDKSLFAEIIHAKHIDNSDTVTNKNALIAPVQGRLRKTK
jgi:hypothetical protein